MIIKTVNFKPDIVKKSSNTMEITGWASIYEIVDLHNSIIKDKAFDKSIQEINSKKYKLPMLLDHNAKTPIGIWTELKNQHSGVEAGLKVKGLIYSHAVRGEGQEVIQAIIDGRISGLSIGARIVKARKEKRGDKIIDILEELELLEISVVTIPANPQARIQDYKEK
ncbi:HK97 family phage prohead protease [Candidatus Gromoviella agglomerans]|uniref:HK97 family phage prohead protease n=1 Tax=Candidatus Gromoviella agglomerans TaxID=2806609 RepID=UPI001E32F4F4|nr:HK97 family phage prohead protease [Candidatus Gromoviella agglomerans]UFX98261.1 Phage prohead protease [Candidatus Gromoviella agglomerans]